MSKSKPLTSVVVLCSLVASVMVFAAPNTASAQVRPAMVRNVDEPARVPYFASAQPTCPFLNECDLIGPIVPAGKRLRVTRLEGILVGQTTSIFFALMLNDNGHPVLMFPAQPISGAFFGSVVSFNQEVDFFFEAGQTPLLSVGNMTSIVGDPRSRLTLVGYLVDILP
jgi:hypothetical protein